MNNDEYLKKTYLRFQDITKQGINITDQHGNTTLMNTIMDGDTFLSTFILKEENIDLNAQTRMEILR